MGQIQLVTALILIGLFSIAILSFAVNFAIDNDAAVSIADDAIMSSTLTNTMNNVSAFDDSSENQYSSILNTTIAPGSSEPQSAAPFAITPLNALGVMKNMAYMAYYKIFGTGSGFAVFITTFIGLIVFMLGLYVYKTLRGLPD